MREPLAMRFDERAVDVTRHPTVSAVDKHRRRRFQGRQRRAGRVVGILAWPGEAIYVQHVLPAPLSPEYWEPGVEIRPEHFDFGNRVGLRRPHSRLLLRW